jgi:hypothetical protein
MSEQPVELRLDVDRSKITLGDLRFIAQMSGNKSMSPETMERMFDMLERVIVGGIEHIPYDALPQVMEAVSSALNPETELKN